MPMTAILAGCSFSGSFNSRLFGFWASGSWSFHAEASSWCFRFLFACFSCARYNFYEIRLMYFGCCSSGQGSRSPKSYIKNIDTTCLSQHKQFRRNRNVFPVSGWRKTHFWQSAEYSLNFKANDDKLDFDNKSNLDNANDNYSGGLFVLGLCLCLKTPDIRSFLLENGASRQAFCQYLAVRFGGRCIFSDPGYRAALLGEEKISTHPALRSLVS